MNWSMYPFITSVPIKQNSVFSRSGVFQRTHLSRSVAHLSSLLNG